MPIPTWMPGQILAAADVNSWMVPLAAVKPSDQGVTSSTTFVNDTALVLPVAASATYIMDCYLSYTAAAGGDLKWTWSGPAGTPVLRYDALHNEGGSTALSNSILNYGLTSGVVAAGAGAGTGNVVIMRGTLRTDVTAGNLQLQWAQNASNATATTVKQDSHLVLQRVG